jgi:hypothetical protein
MLALKLLLMVLGVGLFGSAAIVVAYDIYVETRGTSSTVPPRTASPGAIAFRSTSRCVVVVRAAAT